MTGCQPKLPGDRRSGLSADDGTGKKIEQYLVNNYRHIAPGHAIDDPATNNGGNPEKHQNSQFSADIHRHCSPVAVGNRLWQGLEWCFHKHAFIINNIRKSKGKNHRSMIIAMPIPPPMHMVIKPVE
jgi:hypothetical protein